MFPDSKTGTVYRRVVQIEVERRLLVAAQILNRCRAGGMSYRGQAAQEHLVTPQYVVAEAGRDQLRLLPIQPKAARKH